LQDVPIYFPRIFPLSPRAYPASPLHSHNLPLPCNQERNLMSSSRKIESARANAAQSRGSAGKRRSSIAAREHGLTARTLVLSNEAREHFDHTVEDNLDELVEETVEAKMASTALLGCGDLRPRAPNGLPGRRNWPPNSKNSTSPRASPSPTRALRKPSASPHSTAMKPTTADIPQGAVHPARPTPRAQKCNFAERTQSHFRTHSQP